MKKKNGRQIEDVIRLTDEQQKTLLEDRTDQRMFDTVRIMTTTKDTTLRGQTKPVVGAPLVEK